MTTKRSPGDVYVVDVYMAIKIRLRRNTMKVSQDELAKTIGVVRNSIVNYEQCKTKIPASNLFFIAQVLNMSISDLFDGLDSNLAKNTMTSEQVTSLMKQPDAELVNTFGQMIGLLSVSD